MSEAPTRRFKRAFVTSCCALVLCQTALAQSVEWNSLNAEAAQLFAQGKYDLATVPARKALEIAERDFGPEHFTVAISLTHLAELYMRQGQYAQAEPFYKRTLAMMEKNLGPGHPGVVAPLTHLAELYIKMGRTEEAKRLNDRAAEIRSLKR